MKNNMPPIELMDKFQNYVLDFFKRIDFREYAKKTNSLARMGFLAELFVRVAETSKDNKTIINDLSRAIEFLQEVRDTYAKERVMEAN